VKTIHRRYRRPHRRTYTRKPPPPPPIVAPPPPPAEPPTPKPPPVDAYELAMWYRQAWCARHFDLADRFLAQLKDLARSPLAAKEAAFEEQA
jgi:hypothetical protein